MNRLTIMQIAKIMFLSINENKINDYIIDINNIVNFTNSIFTINTENINPMIRAFFDNHQLLRNDNDIIHEDCDNDEKDYIVPKIL
jgi:aspartyl/glutamyl-tRNA(Asn/Gln) amidotransferase C subunit